MKRTHFEQRFDGITRTFKNIQNVNTHLALKRLTIPPMYNLTLMCFQVAFVWKMLVFIASYQRVVFEHAYFRPGCTVIP